MVRKVAVVLGSLTLASLALAAYDAVTLKRVVTVGDKATYTLKVQVDVNGNTAELTSVTDREITKADADAYTIVNHVHDQKLSIGGNDVDQPEGTTTAVYKLSGEPVSQSTPDGQPGDLRMSNLDMLLLPAKPVSVGDTWSYDGTKPVPFHVDYKLVGDEKIGDWDCWKIEVKAKETQADGGAMESTVWIAKADGNKTKETAKLTNVFREGVPMPLNGTFTLLRTK